MSRGDGGGGGVRGTDRNSLLESIVTLLVLAIVFLITSYIANNLLAGLVVAGLLYLVIHYHNKSKELERRLAEMNAASSKEP